MGRGPYVLGNGLHGLGNGLYVLGNGPHLLGIMLHSEFCCIWNFVTFGIMSHPGSCRSVLCQIQHYVAFGLMSFGIVSFGVMSFGLLPVYLLK